jgi:hypothetical protein
MDQVKASDWRCLSNKKTGNGAVYGDLADPTPSDLKYGRGNDTQFLQTPKITS